MGELPAVTDVGGRSTWPPDATALHEAVSKSDIPFGQRVELHAVLDRFEARIAAEERVREAFRSLRKRLVRLPEEGADGVDAWTAAHIDDAEAAALAATEEATPTGNKADFDMDDDAYMARLLSGEATTPRANTRPATPAGSEPLLSALWQCGVESGMDTDGNAGPDAMVAGMGAEGFAAAMVEQVRQLRRDYDEALAATPAERAVLPRDALDRALALAVEDGVIEDADAQEVRDRYLAVLRGSPAERAVLLYDDEEAVERVKTGLFAVFGHVMGNVPGVTRLREAEIRSEDFLAALRGPARRTGYVPAVPMTDNCPRPECPVAGRHGHAEINPHLRGSASEARDEAGDA